MEFNSLLKGQVMHFYMNLALSRKIAVLCLLGCDME